MTIDELAKAYALANELREEKEAAFQRARRELEHAANQAQNARDALMDAVQALVAYHAAMVPVDAHA